MNRDAILQQFAQLENAFGLVDRFLLAIAYSFTWTGHAEMDDEFINSAVSYLQKGKKRPLKKATEYSGRFGPERLGWALESWRTILEQLPETDVETKGARELCAFQEACFEIAGNLAQADEICGVGPWLFCAPFKIAAVHRRDLWRSKHLDDLWMPLGMEVIRGIRKLIRADPEFGEDIQHLLAEEEGGLLEGIGTVLLAQAKSKELAESAGTRVLHINSGLYLYGKGELED